MKLMLFAALLASQTALADCMAIRDYDKRQACFAEERGSPDTCTSIKSYDDRQLCRSRARRDTPFFRKDRW